MVLCQLVTILANQAYVCGAFPLQVFSMCILSSWKNRSASFSLSLPSSVTSWKLWKVTFQVEQVFSLWCPFRVSRGLLGKTRMHMLSTSFVGTSQNVKTAWHLDRLLNAGVSHLWYLMSFDSEVLAQHLCEQSCSPCVAGSICQCRWQGWPRQLCDGQQNCVSIIRSAFIGMTFSVVLRMTASDSFYSCRGVCEVQREHSFVELLVSIVCTVLCRLWVSGTFCQLVNA